MNEMKQQFTPGPWTVSRSKMATDEAFDYAISAEGAPVIAEAFGRDAKGGWPAAEANARLIAAAPDLYRELYELVEWLNANQRSFEGEFSMDEALAGPRAALSRATASSQAPRDEIHEMHMQTFAKPAS